MTDLTGSLFKTDSFHTFPRSSTFAAQFGPVSSKPGYPDRRIKQKQKKKKKTLQNLTRPAPD